MKWRNTAEEEKERPVRGKTPAIRWHTLMLDTFDDTQKRKEVGLETMEIRRRAHLFKKKNAEEFGTEY